MSGDFDPAAGHRLCLEIADEIPIPGELLDAHLLEQEGDLLTTLYMADLARWALDALCGTYESATLAQAQQLLTRLEEALGHGGIVVDLIATGFVEGLPAKGAPCSGFLDQCGPLLRGQIANEYRRDP